MIKTPKQKTQEYPKTLTNRYGRVKIYRQARGDGAFYFTVAWSLGRGRARKTFADEVAAENHADLILEQLKNGQCIAGQLTSGEALYFRACEQKLGTVPLMVAVDFYLAAHGAGAHSSEPVEILVKDYLLDLKARGVSNRDRLTVSAHLTRFAEAMQKPIATVKPTDIDAYLQAKKCTNRTRNNTRVSICRMWNWAIKKGRMPKMSEGVAKASSTYKEDAAGSPGIFSPSDFAKILGHIEDAWLPYVTIAGFAGLRQAEIIRLSWTDIRMDEKVIILGADITKTNKRRVAHMPDNLIAWLNAFEGEKEGLVCPTTRPNKATSAAAKAAEVEWVQNGLRHSYISYQMAILRDAGKVAEQCGNSASEVQASYKANALEADALKWFAIAPEA